jgi:two-component system LytT family response regulator
MKSNQIKCLIIDQQEISRTAIKKIMSLDPTLTLAGECDNLMEAHKVIQKHAIDVVFLDIEMQGRSGVELVQSLNGKEPLIILITPSTDTAAETVQSNVIDSLAKPVLPSRFYSAIDKVRKQLISEGINTDDTDGESVFAGQSNVIKKLKLADILYLQSEGDFVKIHLDNQIHLIYSSLRSVEQKLPTSFLRVHSSYIINLSKVDAIDCGILVIKKKLVPTSDIYRSALNRRIHLRG